jgi:hypothetical protein
MADLGTTETSEVTVADSAGVNKLKVNTDGSILTVGSTSFQYKTYSAGFTGLVVPAAATDVFTITGSGTATIYVTRISVSGSTTAGSGLSINVSLLRRTTANSGGTSTTATNVRHDTNDSAATATVRGYTANPTVGTLDGIIRSNRYQAPTVGIDRAPLVWDFSDLTKQPIVLRGTSAVLAVNLNGVTITNPVFGLDIEWMEI